MNIIFKIKVTFVKLLIFARDNHKNYPPVFTSLSATATYVTAKVAIRKISNPAEGNVYL